MRKIFFVIAFALAAFVSCDEWEPVYTFDYDEPGDFTPVTLTPNTTIAQLKALYTKSPVDIQEDLVIGGQVISSDQTGNIYKSLYIQDETGAIELKLGKTGIYNDYKLGQWVYVKCSGLTLGAYNGMLQIGYKDESGEYETTYLNVQYIIDTHVFRGLLSDPVKPVEVSSSELLKSENFGKYVTLKGLTHGNRIFCLAYVDPDADKTAMSNRIFLSDQTWGVKTWAMSKNGYISYLKAGNFDNAVTADKGNKISAIKDKVIANATAYSVSHYFTFGSKDVQVRSSGYAKFADTQIDESILSGASKVNLTGILTSYKGEAQFTLIDLTGVEIVK